MRDRSPAFLERLLRSTWGRVLLAVLLVGAFSLAVSVPRSEMAELRGDEVSRLRIFLDEVLRWGLWGLAAWPLVALARGVLRRGSWVLFLLVQIPLSGAVSYGYLHLDHLLHAGREVAGPPGAEPEAGRPRPGERPWRPPGGMRRGPGGEFGPGPGPGPEGGPPPEERRFPRRGRMGEPDLTSPFWRFRWIQAVFIYWVVLGLGGGVQAFLAMRDKERRAAELELGAERLRGRLTRAQVDALRAQLQPHFLFNALNSVGGLVRAGEDSAALRTLAAIGELLRSTLEYGETRELPLDEELRVVEKYLDIERVRLGERLALDLSIEAGVGAARVPALVLLPLVENAVRHGVAPRPEGGRVRVEARREGEELLIVVEDDGRGFPVEVLDGRATGTREDRRSIGLENTRARLAAMYGEAGGIELENLEPTGARVRVRVPYREGEEPA